MVYVNSYRKFFGSLSRHTNVVNDKANKHQKTFGHLANFALSEGGCYFAQSQNLYY